MKKGFTLIEILAVVTIIGLIFILVIPKITTSLKNKKKDVDTTTNNLIVTAAKNYVADNKSKFDKVDNNTYCLPLTTLTKKDYLDSPVKNVTDDLDITNSKSVKITYKKGFKYEVVDKKECRSVTNAIIVDGDGNKFRISEFIQSTGAQYIDTGVYPKSTTKIIFDFAIMETALCRNGWGSSGNAESFFWGTNNTVFESSVSSSWEKASSYVELDTKRHIFELSSGSQKFDGVEYGTTEIGNTAGENQTMYLFANHVEWDNKPNTFCKERIYSAKIYDGDTLIRDYIPVVDENNRPCLFDKKEKKCYYNQGADEFYYLINYPTINYLQSTGTQYIDTGVYPKSTTKIIFDFAIMETTSCRNGWGSNGNAESYFWGTNNTVFESSVSSSWEKASSYVELDTKRHVFELSSGSQKFDGVEYGTTEIGNTAGENQTMYLFANHVEWDNKPNTFCKERIYSAKIYDGDTLIRDYIPVVDDKNKAYFFDKVERKYYYNQGTGEFLYG